MKTEKKSPIKDKPLRYPGQSLDDQRLDVAHDKIFAPMMVALLMLMLAGLEWWRYIHPVRPNPWLYSFFALLTTLYAIWRIWLYWPKLAQLRQASEGEKAVGQFLERLRESGYQVFHDVLGDGFNVDHVLIGPAGIFTIETKTWSKPVRGQAKIQFDGEKLLVEDREPERDPIIQAKAQASWLRELLLQSTGRNYGVRPVVLFPGWFIEQSTGSTQSFWVLEPKALPAFLANSVGLLTSDDVKLASFHLSRFVRTSEKTKR